MSDAAYEIAWGAYREALARAARVPDRMPRPAVAILLNLSAILSSHGKLEGPIFMSQLQGVGDRTSFRRGRRWLETHRIVKTTTVGNEVVWRLLSDAEA